MFSSLQTLIVLVLSVAALVGAVWGFIDAARYSASTFEAAGKQTKPLWLVFLGAASLVSFISLPYPVGRGTGIVGFLGIAAIAAVIIYFVGVRPALRQIEPRVGGNGNTKSGW